MPKLDINPIDYRAMPKDISSQYLARMVDEQKAYWWFAFFLGGALFMISIFL